MTLFSHLGTHAGAQAPVETSPGNILVTFPVLYLIVSYPSCRQNHNSFPSFPNDAFVWHRVVVYSHAWILEYGHSLGYRRRLDYFVVTELSEQWENEEYLSCRPLRCVTIWLRIQSMLFIATVAKIWEVDCWKNPKARAGIDFATLSEISSFHIIPLKMFAWAWTFREIGVHLQLYILWSQLLYDHSTLK